MDKIIKAWTIQVGDNPFAISRPYNIRLFSKRGLAVDYGLINLYGDYDIVEVEVRILPPKKKEKTKK